MYQALKNLSATQQIGVMFIIVFGLLIVASLGLFCSRCVSMKTR